MRRLSDRERVNVLLDEVSRLQRELLAAEARLEAITDGTVACLQSALHMPPSPPETEVVFLTPRAQTVLPADPFRRRRRFL